MSPVDNGSTTPSVRTKKSTGLSTSTILLVIGASAISFLAGTLFALSFNECPTLPPPAQAAAEQAKGTPLESPETEERILVRKEMMEPLQREVPPAEPAHTAASHRKGQLFPETVRKFVTGMAHVDKAAFTEKFELGVPLDQPTKGSEDILLLYSGRKSMPTKYQRSLATNIQQLTTEEATENCLFLNMIYTHHEGQREQCTAIIPQYESFHIHKWMRLPSGKGGVDKNNPLRPVGRGLQPNGIDPFKVPIYERHTKRLWEMLRKYLDSVDDVLNELRPIVNRIKIKNTVIVMVCNHGQSELLVNFACSTHARGLDISNIIVFATDEETKELAESVGLAAYYDERNFGEITSEAAKEYGDRHFTAMMMAKVICVQLISLLGVDLLFQDVDIVWYKNPLNFFHKNEHDPIHTFDMYYQDDGSHSTRYAPYAPNSGFYYVRYNAKTRHFLTSLLMQGDLVLKTFSHQQAMTAVMAEHASLFGLRVKVLSRDENDFPGGYHYHRKNGEFLRQMFKGEVSPTIFHMSWTKNKDNKLLFLKQMGEWYLQDKCVSKKLADIGVEKDNFVSSCCSKEALVTCHYKDKPSIKPCKDSPALDQGRPSFW
ncbi:Nucleotide-diphospho-sugar transferase [Seminavis robusta]|uniref:Nucleotide-diphospho-sugar transferase n=1 Tax=Seminavis robusta TaxID=568900 RepID=A0A9N8D536_9STRA|nr:Nucleotide-diphospho-sugar transferase [Seminavis robusta]|eukprot:Sro6_g005230.1 Nucleotide-diphospho-sugar transferase (600) ;mRNA; f:128071-130488